jgi:hypothetical protein
MRLAGPWISAAVVALAALAGCGGGGHRRSPSSSPTAPTSSTAPPTPSSVPAADEVLAVPSVGGFYGRCPAGIHEWTVRFINSSAATDTVSYRIGAGARHRAVVQPRGALNFGLRPGSARSHEPADRASGSAAASVPSTPPIELAITQSTEPQSLRVDVRLALASGAGESAQCVLVGSRVSAREYPH